MFASVAHFSVLLAQAATAAPATAPTASAQPPITAYLPFYLLFAVIFYFIFMRPQQRRAKEQAALLSSVRSGDEIVTSGGLHGIVTNAREPGSKTVLVKFAENVKIEVDRTAITSVSKAGDNDNDARANVPAVQKG